MDNTITAIILAAGKGTRMKAPPTKNKVVFELANKPIIKYTYDMLRTVGIQTVVVVIGYASESVRDALGDNVIYALQENPQGTGHAVQVALAHIPDETQTIISMYGDDSAFYPPTLIQQLVEEHHSHQAALTLVTLNKQNPTGLGRIIRENNQVIAIVEEKNATDSQKQISEINTGLYCFNRDFISEAVNNINRNPVSGEYYLTDVVEYAVKHNNPVHTLRWPSDDIWYGVNTPEQLAEAEQRMKLSVL